MLDVAAIKKRIETEGPKHWLHRFEVIPGSGVFTPGNLPKVNFAARAERFGIKAADFKGKRCLDIGAWTGGDTFAMEDLGAKVVATDIQNPYNTGFSLIHDIRRSTADYIQASIYDLNAEQFGTFDIIWCSGVLYHLKHPILALERLNSVCHPGSRLLLQGRSCDYWFFEEDRYQGASLDKIKRQPDTPKTVMNVDCVNEVPLAGFVREKFFDDDSCWFLPNLKCAHAWMKRTGFHVVKSFIVEAPFTGANRVTEGIVGSAIFINAEYQGPPEPEYLDGPFLKRVHANHAQPLLHHYQVPTALDLSKVAVIRGHE